MRLSQVEVLKVAKAITKQVTTTGYKVLGEEKVTTTIVNLINENMDAERRLEDDALRLLKQHKGALGTGLDDEKALRMIKEKLASERKFIL